MSTLKTPSLLKNAFARVSVRNTEAATAEQAKPETRSINSLVAGAFMIVFTASAAMTSAPAQAQTYQSSQSYTTNSPSALVGRVVGVSNYLDNGNSQYQSEVARRNANTRRDAQSRSAGLLGSLVYSVANEALGGRADNYHARSAASIASSAIAGMASNSVYARQSRINDRGWDGNVRSMGEQMSLVTVDVDYGNGRMERIQVRQPVVYSQGLTPGDEVSLQVQTDGRNRSILAIETERSRRGYRPR